MNPKRRDINLQLERIEEELLAESPDSRFAVRDMQERLAEYLRENPDPEQAWAAAGKYVSDYTEARKFKSRGKGEEQMTLFDPNALLVLGDGFRIRMSDAKQRHVLSAAEQRRLAHEAEENDFMRDMRYFLSRSTAFRNMDETLAEVEARDFGWQEE